MAEKKKPTYCDEHGHTYEPTTVPGWFCCLYPTRYNKRGVVTETCNAVVVCPGCLGCRPAGYTLMFCQTHAHCVLEDFPPLVFDHAAPAQQSFSGDQLSLW